MFILGIDEAGRGPIIGPLVIVCAAISEERINSLKENNVKDSKLLSQKQREEIFKSIEHIIKYELIIVSPDEIDDAVNSRSTNLNWLEADKAADLINKMDAKLYNDITKVIVDCPSTNTNAYKQKLMELINNKDIDLIVEHKADLNHLIVGAASIIAKVTREKELEKLKKKFKIDFGSGYPSDPKTISFLKNNWNKKEYQHLFRKSWQTYKNLADKGKQRSIGEY
ncbi:MAG: ribonuclease HII [Candidatus Woesearchaeota archaeon]|nr:MAG: ribonuclease HII [Candidatus Woesearchaeota archaeon]